MIFGVRGDGAKKCDALRYVITKMQSISLELIETIEDLFYFPIICAIFNGIDSRVYLDLVIYRVMLRAEDMILHVGLTVWCLVSTTSTQQRRIPTLYKKPSSCGVDCTAMDHASLLITFSCKESSVTTRPSADTL